MFKSVEYVGFDGRPDLKAKAEQLTPVLAGEIRHWRDEVEVRWCPSSEPGCSLDLALSLTVADGIAGSGTGTFTAADLDEMWLAQSRCRDVWSSLLWELSISLEDRIEEALSDPLEV